MKKNLKIALLHAIIGANLAVFASGDPTTGVFHGNLEIIDDPDSSNVTEGVLIVRKNLFISDTFTNGHYYEDPSYSGYGTNNLILGLSLNTYSISDRSILMGRGGTFAGAQNSIMMSNVDAQLSGTNSIFMGGPGYLYGSNAIFMGRGNFSGDNAIMLGVGTFAGTRSIISSSGDGTSSGSIEDSIIFTGSTRGTNSIARSIIMGLRPNNNVNYISDSFVMGNVASGDNSQFSYLHGNNLSYDPYMTATHIFLFGSDSQVKLEEYYGYVEHVFSVGNRNKAMVSNVSLVGEGLASQSRYSFTVGRYNEYRPFQAEVGNPGATAFNTQMDDDLIFTVGNGTSEQDRSNALEVSRNGDTTVKGRLKADEMVVGRAAGGIPMGDFGRR